jgi:hypothetical protein
MSNLHFLQKFEIKTVHRSQIKAADYNPRTIGNKNRELLNSNIQKRGLLETLVWNKRSGNLVSGHRRLEKLDAAYEAKYKSLDYELTVSVCDLSDKEEKEQNIFFNNPNAQGDWDREMMLAIIPDIDVKSAGLTDDDLAILGIDLDLSRNNISATDDIIASFETLKKENKQAAIDKGGKAYPPHMDYKAVKSGMDAKSAEEGSAEKDEHEDYFVVTFSTWQAKEAFQTRFEFHERERYIKGELLTERINQHLGE